MAPHKTSHRIQYAPTDESMTYYPESDGKPIAETDLHRILIFNTFQQIEAHLADIPDAYVSGNLLIYDVPGNPRRSISPDVLVSFGIGKKMRRTYKIWEEGKPPDFVMEFSSKSTYKNDLGRKKIRYASIGVREYFLYDADRRYLPDPLIGFRQNAEGRYVEIPHLTDGGIPSAVLGIEFRLQDDGIGLYNPISAQWLQTPAEKAEAEVARLQAELDRLKG